MQNKILITYFMCKFWDKGSPQIKIAKIKVAKITQLPQIKVAKITQFQSLWEEYVINFVYDIVIWQCYFRW